MDCAADGACFSLLTPQQQQRLPTNAGDSYTNFRATKGRIAITITRAKRFLERCNSRPGDLASTTKFAPTYKNCMLSIYSPLTKNRKSLQSVESDTMPDSTRQTTSPGPI